MRGTTKVRASLMACLSAAGPPRIIFLHYWGIGQTESLAKTIKAALDKTKHLPPSP